MLQLARRFLELLGELALRVAAVAAAGSGLTGLQRAPLTLDLLLLPPRELLQLLDHLIDLLIALLHLGALLHLVLVRELVELELEKVREVLGHLAAATTAASTLLHRDLHFVGLFGVLQNLQRALLGQQRFVGLDRFEIRFGRLHLVDCLG